LIGVICGKHDEEIVREFFELFKTPWEFYENARIYEVILTTVNTIEDTKAKCIFVFGSEKKELGCATNINIDIRSNSKERMVAFRGKYFPVYGRLLTFDEKGTEIIKTRGQEETVGFKITAQGNVVYRIGFDLFQEIHFLLSYGQPVEYSHIPTLEMHIAMIRSLIIEAGIPLVEIPPVPAGYNFIVCLTHDVDFVGIRNHKFDHTMWGFIYRAVVGSCLHVIREITGWRKLLKNWIAVLSLPLVYLGIVKDFWDEFDRYLEIEKDLGSTFFIIPFKNREGKDNSGVEQRQRTARYDITDIRPEIKRLIEHHCEIGLHGIDAWNDAQKASEECDRICKEVGNSDIGVRMHWLYYSNRSPQLLEEADFLYDSTFGYNDTVGYRGGTTQVFRPLGAKRLLELPLHIQDTALFYPKRMALTEKEAFELVNTLIKNSKEYGGILTINWHTRSLSPERNWDTFYIELLKILKAENIWFATANQAVDWFNKRRSISFDAVKFLQNKVQVKLSSNNDSNSPALLLRVHVPRIESTATENYHRSKQTFSDIPWFGEDEVEATF